MREYLDGKLQSSNMLPRVLLSKARLMDVRDWETPIMNDSKQLPFYYHLGTQLKYKRVFELGFGLGLTAAAFVQGCETVEEYVGFQVTNENFYYSLRLGSATLREYFRGNIKLDLGGRQKFEGLVATNSWDVGMITEEVDKKSLRYYLDKIWVNLSSNALIIVDHLHDENRMGIFQDWCKSVSREPDIYQTRYTLGIAKR